MSVYLLSKLTWTECSLEFSDQNLFIVHHPCCWHGCCLKLLTFPSLIQNHGANFYHTWYKASLGKGDSSFTEKNHWVLISYLNQHYGITTTFQKCFYWYELFLRWAVWPMGLLFFYYLLKNLSLPQAVFSSIWYWILRIVSY